LSKKCKKEISLSRGPRGKRCQEGRREHLPDLFGDPLVQGTCLARSQNRRAQEKEKRKKRKKAGCIAYQKSRAEGGLKKRNRTEL